MTSEHEEHLDELAGYRPAGEPRPAGPDAARDRRIDIYRDRERRRAARALDRYIETVFAVAPRTDEQRAVMSTAGEHLVEAVGDYVLSRIGERCADGGRPCTNDNCPCKTQHNRHYGVPFDPEAGPCIGMCAGCDPSCHLLQHKSDSGVPIDDPDGLLDRTESVGPTYREMRIEAAHHKSDHGVSDAEVQGVPGTCPPWCKQHLPFAATERLLKDAGEAVESIGRRAPDNSPKGRPSA